MRSLFHASRKAISDLGHLMANMGRDCRAYISNDQIGEEWMALAAAEAEEEWRRRRQATLQFKTRPSIRRPAL
jgi:hypothetical protein